MPFDGSGKLAYPPRVLGSQESLSGALTLTRRKPAVVIFSHRACLGEMLSVRLWKTGRFRSVRVLMTSRDVRAAARRGKADIVLVDPGNPCEDVFDLLRALRRVKPPSRVVLLAGAAAAGWVWRALNAGAAGYLSKCATVDEILRALQAVSEGQSYFSPCAARVMTALARSEGEFVSLTAREFDVLHRISDGLSSKEIARSLDLSPKTVDMYRGRLMERVGAHSATALVKFAFQHRYVDALLPDEPRYEPDA